MTPITATNDFVTRPIAEAFKKQVPDGVIALVGTADGFAVVRDPIACKHAVMAETDDWVAMATEYRAIAHLPGADDAKIWEPEPTTIYTWGGNA